MESVGCCDGSEVMTNKQIKNMIKKKLLEINEFYPAAVEEVWHFTLTPIDDHPDDWELAVEDAIIAWHMQEKEV